MNKKIEFAVLLQVTVLSLGFVFTIQSSSAAEERHLSAIAGSAPVAPLLKGAVNVVPISIKPATMSAKEACAPGLVQPCNQVLKAFSGAFNSNNPRLLDAAKEILHTFCANPRIGTDNKVVALSLVEELINHDQAAFGLSKIQRASIALNTLSNLASPSGNIDQVGKTCKFASYEVRIATLYPEIYASLITQVCLTGQFRCTDGSVIIFPSNSISNAETVKYSNWASRIFQVTMGNIAWQSSTERPDKLPAEKGTLRFELVGKVEGLKDYSLDSNKGLSVYYRDGQRVTSPGTNRVQEKLANKLLTGQDSITVINEDFKGKAEPGSFNYNDFEQLQKFLQFTAEGQLPNVQFPLLISIDGERLQKGANSKEIFRNREGTHLATIMSYDPSTQKVELNNTWGVEDDFVGARALTFQQLCQYLPRPKP